MTNHVADYGWTLWGVIGGMAVVTIMNRAGLIVLAHRFILPQGLQRALRYAPVSALAAIVVPDLFLQHGQIDVSIDNVRLVAGLIGLSIALLTRSAVLAIAVGMVLLHGLQRLA